MIHNEKRESDQWQMKQVSKIKSMYPLQIVARRRIILRRLYHHRQNKKLAELYVRQNGFEDSKKVQLRDLNK